MNLKESEHSHDAFDYEAKTWGGHEVRVSPKYLGALRLKYCLDDLRAVSGSVLEVGCGAGGMARAIKAYRPDLEVYGCDLSERSIRAAQADPDGVTFDLGDAYELPYENDSFQAVVMFDVLEHLEEPHTSVAEICRVLEDGGLFHLFIPCEGALYTLHGLLARAGWRAKEKYGGHIQRLTSADVVAILEQAGLEVQDHRWSGHLINQAVDASYFTALSLRGKNTPTSVEGYLKIADPGPIPLAVATLKTAVAVTSYYESKLLAWLPGSGGHFSAIRS